MPSLRTVFALGALASTALASRELVPSSGFSKRQDQSFRPPTNPSNCTPNCGQLCIFPDQGQVCCDPAQSWGCPDNSFCLVDGLCCPDGEDPETCARRNDVELPSNFTPGGPKESESSAPEPTPSDVPPFPTPSADVPTVHPTGDLPTVSAPVPPEFTGAASKVEGSFLAMGLMVLAAL